VENEKVSTAVKQVAPIISDDIVKMLARRVRQESAVMPDTAASIPNADDHNSNSGSTFITDKMNSAK
jgi:hypothetical protein